MRIIASFALAAILVAPPALAQEKSDAVHGKSLYAQCRSCHTPEENSVGPKHCDVIGRKAASLPDYQYSPAMTKSGLTWTPENLDRFLQKPAALVPGNYMPFAGIAKAKDRADIIAYLATLHCS